MGDVSAEPSMEDILSSIKRIIAEEGEVASPPRTRRAPLRPAPLPAFDHDDEPEDNVLELSDPMPDPAPTPPPTPTHDAIASPATMQSTRGALDQLSRLMVKPDADGDGTLEGLVRELLRPMLREWIDANLPGMVEQMVAREIAKITGQQG